MSAVNIHFVYWTPRCAIPLPVETSSGTTVFKFEKFQRLQNSLEYLFYYDKRCGCEEKKYKTRAPSIIRASNESAL